MVLTNGGTMKTRTRFSRKTFFRTLQIPEYTFLESEKYETIKSGTVPFNISLRLITEKRRGFDIKNKLVMFQIDEQEMFKFSVQATGAFREA